VVAVLSVSAPTMRMRPPRPRALLPMVLDAAAKLSRALGDTAVRAVDAARKGQGPSATHGTSATAPALAAPGPHSIFR